MEFLIYVLLVCFQSMNLTGIHWPLITEDEQEVQEVQMERLVAAIALRDDRESSD